MNVTITGDVVSLAVGVGGVILALLGRKDKLPKFARRWLAKITPAEVMKAIELAGKIQNLTPEQKRKEAVGYLQKLTKKELGFSVPTSVANLLIEYIYARVKRGKK